MQAAHDKAAAAKTPAERHAAMQEGMKAMKDSMTMMSKHHGAMGCMNMPGAKDSGGMGMMDMKLSRGKRDLMYTVINSRNPLELVGFLAQNLDT